MTIHHMRDYSANPKTAANNVYPPEAPMIEWADPDDYTDAHIDRVPEYDDEHDGLTVVTMLILCGILTAGLLAYAFVPVGVW